ncbi:dihydrofolate reductase [Nesterenkonia lutea]|uniref:Dihydrofolate reductase n=2 Tax=Nesterenkonia lutea TaxID=272919 RepID=A0ABR9JFW2_9MICC|nr:dihydrofolate reductase [Nesterenkonia lutea]
MIVSLDGYVTDERGDFQWGVPDEEVLAVINQQMTGVGTFLYGRRMYEVMSVWETDASLPYSPRSVEFAEIWSAADKVVFSTTLNQPYTSRTRIEREFVPAEIQRLKDATAADLTVDGPTLAAHALRAGLVDEIHQLVCPVVLGGGLRMLPERRMDLRLLEERGFANGMVQMRYATLP